MKPYKSYDSKKPEEYKWSSYSEYIGKLKKNKWLECGLILGQYSRDEDIATKKYKAFVEEGVSLKENFFKELKGGLILGREDFIDEIKKRAKLKRHREVPESKRLVRSLQCKDVITAVAKKLE